MRVVTASPTLLLLEKGSMILAATSDSVEAAMHLNPYNGVWFEYRVLDNGTKLELIGARDDLNNKLYVKETV